MSQDKPNDSEGFFKAGRLTEQLALIGLLVFLAGTVSTETYYHAFNVKYQSLNFSAEHIMYRGITLLLSAPHLAVFYLITAMWINLDALTRKRWLRKMGRFTGAVTWLLVAALTIGVWWCSARAGRKNARRDMVRATTSLPEVLAIRKDVTGEPLDTYKGCRLLLLTDSYAILFYPLPNENENDQPKIIRLSTDDAHVIETY